MHEELDSSIHNALSQGPDAILNEFARMQLAFGEHTGRVFGELEPGISGTAFGVFTSDSPLAKRVFADTHNQKPADMLPADIKMSEVEKEVESEIADVLETLTMSNRSADLQSKTRGAAVKLASYYVSQGKSVSEAAKYARQLMFDSSDYEGTLRVPKVDKNGTAIATDAVFDGAENLKEYAVTKFGLDLIEQETSTLSEKDLLRSSREAFSQGVWKQSPDGNGAILYVPTANGLNYTPAKMNGKPFVFTWDMMTQEAGFSGTVRPVTESTLGFYRANRTAWGSQYADL
jgi:hypothetical protein